MARPEKEKFTADSLNEFGEEVEAAGQKLKEIADAIRNLDNDDPTISLDSKAGKSGLAALRKMYHHACIQLIEEAEPKSGNREDKNES